MNNDRTRQIQRTAKRDAATKPLATGLVLAGILRGPAGSISRIAWSPDGRLLATPSADGTVQLWDVGVGEIVRTLPGHDRTAFVVRFDPSGHMLASGGVDGDVMLWSVKTGELIRRVGHHRDGAFALVFDPKTGHLISGGNDATIRIWDTTTGRQLARLDGHNGSVNALALYPERRLLASGSLDTNVCIWDLDRLDLRYTLRGHRSSNLTVAVSPTAPWAISGNQDTTIRMWDMENGELIREMHVHSGMLQCVDCSPDGKLIASKSSDGTLKLWNLFGGVLATVAEPTLKQGWSPGIAFHPSRPLLAIVASDPDERTTGLDTHIHLYEYDASVLQAIASDAPPVLAYVTARIVLVGDSGVGKTALGWRLAHREFKQHPSTHGQQFWPLGQLDHARADGAQCEAILWDLAGQPDYRLTHGLFLDDADLALILFDPTTPENPLRTAEFWLKQLRGARAEESLASATPTPRTEEAAQGRLHCPVILVAARADRGEGWLSADELATFCEFHGIEALHVTSALTNEGVPELLERMRAMIAWDRQPATVTNDTFKRIRDRVFTLKASRVEQILVTPAELRTQLETEAAGWRIADDELTTAIGHLATHGHVTRLTAKGQAWVLLVPELLNNLAASFVLEARRNVHGLGALEERQLIAGSYHFPELELLSAKECEILTDAVTSLFIARNVCYRETDPLTASTYLIFPGLINLDRPEIPHAQAVETGVAYTLIGAVENVYASLVVLLGYTNTFARRNQWRHHAQYVMGNGQVCGFRVDQQRPGERDVVLYFGTDVRAPERMVFQGLFESFLTRDGLTWTRDEPLKCAEGHLVGRTVIRERRAAGATSLFCAVCGRRIDLGPPAAIMRLSPAEHESIEIERRVAEARSRFEGAAYQMTTYAMGQFAKAPSCFISYARGSAEYERWVTQLATDLLQAGVDVVLDRWENARIGANIPRFVERVGSADRVVVIGTPEYRRKYDNSEPMRGFVAAAEGDLIGLRLIGTEAQKATVLPVLLDGTDTTAFPLLLHGRVYADFRDAVAYFDRVIDLVLSIYEIEARHPLAIELRGSTAPPRGQRHEE